MAKIKVIKEINMRANNQVIVIPVDSYIDVAESMAVYFCNEDIEAMSIEERKYHVRRKHAIRTPAEEQSSPHQDYTGL